MLPSPIPEIASPSRSNRAAVIDINNYLPAGWLAVIDISNCPLAGRSALRQMNNRSRAARPVLPDADNRPPAGRAAVFHLDKRAPARSIGDINIANHRRAGWLVLFHINNPKENLLMSDQLTYDALRTANLAV